MIFGDCPLRVLAIGAHPDDVELGAAGLIQRLISEHAAEITSLVLTTGVRRRSRGGELLENRGRIEEARRAGALLGVRDVRVLAFADGELHLNCHDVIAEIEDALTSAVQSGRPYDLILTHGRGDTHGDHREAYEATIAAAKSFRGSVLLYQSPSTIPNEFRPTLFVGLAPEVLERKVRAIAAHASQNQPYMQREQVEVLASAWARFHRLHGQQLEAFEIHRAMWCALEPSVALPAIRRASFAIGASEAGRFGEAPPAARPVMLHFGPDARSMPHDAGALKRV